MSKTVTKGLLAMPEPRAGKQQLRIKLRQILATHMFEFTPFEQIPNPLLRIEFSRISRQAFRVETFGSSLPQKLFGCLAAMDRRAIPNDQHLPRKVTQELFEKAHDMGGLQGASDRKL